MPTWDVLDDALSHLESPAFEKRWYAAMFRERLELELKRIFAFLEGSSGGVELYPSKESMFLAEVVMGLRGADCSGHCELIQEAALVLEGERDANGKLPGRVQNNYYTLRYALRYEDCEDWTIIALAKSVVLA